MGSLSKNELDERFRRLAKAEKALTPRLYSRHDLLRLWQGARGHPYRRHKSYTTMERAAVRRAFEDAGVPAVVSDPFAWAAGKEP